MSHGSLTKNRRKYTGKCLYAGESCDCVFPKEDRYRCSDYFQINRGETLEHAENRRYPEVSTWKR
jgi:hypothetical protein